MDFLFFPLFLRGCSLRCLCDSFAGTVFLSDLNVAGGLVLKSNQGIRGAFKTLLGMVPVKE